jgi:hypothetical protein
MPGRGWGTPPPPFPPPPPSPPPHPPPPPPPPPRHWFDMGPDPEFTAIRFFNNQEGWVAQFTGDDIGARFPKYE